MQTKFLAVLGIFTCFTGFACAQIRTQPDSAQTPWSQLSLSTCGVDSFLSKNPDSDGTGVVIAVLDTGVDPSIPGLAKTPDGDVKVVDVQDFTGQGDIDLHWVNLDDEGNIINYEDDGAPIAYAIPELASSSNGERRRYWFGTIDERKFVNSDVADLNDNGTTDDSFPVLVTAFVGDGDDQAICFVDTNMDRSFADEKALKSYKLEFDTFTLHRDKPEQQIEPVTFAINIFLRQNKIVLVYDDGAHGTHVAGIAAGYSINNQPGLSGVAPGAKVMGLKIGKNSIGGVSSTAAMKRALEYAARYAREHNVHVVCNMSYGVESVIEGHADLDRFIDRTLAENPSLIFCTSAGNEGPGLSSVGTPAAAQHVITVGALLAADTARDVQGFSIDGAVTTLFSSRGGETPKPDIATPGWCTSTVPRYVTGGDFWAGTSMASPYAAGLCAVIISDAMAKNPGQKIRACDVKKALHLASKPLNKATPNDVGFGVPDVAEAARLLDSLTKEAKDDPIIGYKISTACPHGHNGSAPAAYWRSSWFPSKQPQTFTIRPIFAPGVDGSDKTSFTRRFALKSNSPWCKVDQEHVYLRSEQSTRVFVQYDKAALTEPGMYVGTVDAIHDGRVAFTLRSTIIVPHRFSADEDYTKKLTNMTVQGWQTDRHFFAVPPGATALQVTLSAPEGEESYAAIDRIYDPTGKQLRSRANRLNARSGRSEVQWMLNEDLMPGVWEFDVSANRPDKDWPYELEAKFFGVSSTADSITSWGDEPHITNVFEEPLPVSLNGQIEGFRMHKEANFEGLDDELSYTVSLGEHFSGVRIKLEMTPEAYATTTDIGVAVEDSSGKAIYSSGFSNRTFDTTVSASGTVHVKIRGGFAIEDFERETPITVNIDSMLATPIPISVEANGESTLELVPQAPVELSISLDGDLPEAPSGTFPTGYVRVQERPTKNTVLKLDVNID